MDNKELDKNTIYVPLFNKEIEVVCDNNVNLEYKNLCLNHLLNMEDSLIDELCNKTLEYYKLYNEYENPDMPKEIFGRDILKYINIINIFIEEPDANIPTIHLEGNCTWEKEHGIEISILGNKIIYVGEYTNHSPWEEYNFLNNNLQKEVNNKIPSNPNNNFNLVRDNASDKNKKQIYLILFICFIPMALMFTIITIFGFMSFNTGMKIVMLLILISLIIFEIYLFKQYRRLKKNNIVNNNINKQVYDNKICDNRIEEIINYYKELTKRECYFIKCEEETTDILDNKLGGNPYLPIGELYPLDSKNSPMELLFQINLKDIELENYPKEGILEVFVTGHEIYPTEYKVKYYKEIKEYQKEFPVINYNYKFIKEPIKISFDKTTCFMPISNNEFESNIIMSINKVLNKNITSLKDIKEELNIERIKELLMNDNSISTVGGYPDFTQGDFRVNLGEYTECLLKLDSLTNKNINIGDDGILNVLMNKQDLVEEKFENSKVYWDCY